MLAPTTRRDLRCLLLAVALPALAGAQGYDVRVVDPPARLGATGTGTMLRRTFPAMTVTDTGHGELVLGGAPSQLDQAVTLLKRLDRPSREVIVELHRGAAERLGERTDQLALNLGNSRTPSTFRRSTGTQRSSGTRSLRLREGSSASLFLGAEVPYVSGGGLLTQTRFVSAGQGLRLRLVRVDPGEGALLEVLGETGSLGASTPAGPVIQRESLGTTTYAPFGVPVALGGNVVDEAGGSGGPGATGAVVLTEEVRGPRGLPTGRFRRRPAQGSVSLGGTRTRRSGQLGYTVVVREVPEAVARDPRRPSTSR